MFEGTSEEGLFIPPFAGIPLLLIGYVGLALLFITTFFLDSGNFSSSLSLDDYRWPR